MKAMVRKRERNEMPVGGGYLCEYMSGWVSAEVEKNAAKSEWLAATMNNAHVYK